MPADERAAFQQHEVGRNLRDLARGEPHHRSPDRLADGDLPAMADLLNASHASLRDDFEVSTRAVEATRERMG